jgi:hypothetical protein
MFWVTINADPSVWPLPRSPVHVSSRNKPGQTQCAIVSTCPCFVHFNWMSTVCPVQQPSIVLSCPVMSCQVLSCRCVHAARVLACHGDSGKRKRGTCLLVEFLGFRRVASSVIQHFTFATQLYLINDNKYRSLVI